MSNRVTSDIYSKGGYSLQNPTWHVQDSAWKAEQILKIMEKNIIRPDSICEVGCGAGEVLHQLYLSLPNTFEFVGYDIAPQAIDLCQERTNSRLRFYLRDILDDENVYFDLIFGY